MIEAAGVVGLIIAALGVWLGYVIGRTHGYRQGCEQTHKALFGAGRPLPDFRAERAVLPFKGQSPPR